MKKIYKQPVVIALAVTSTHLIAESIQMTGDQASTDLNSDYNTLSRRGSFWDEEE